MTMASHEIYLDTPIRGQAVRATIAESGGKTAPRELTRPSCKSFHLRVPSDDVVDIFAAARLFPKRFGFP
jgi:hypothetical protein